MWSSLCSWVLPQERQHVCPQAYVFPALSPVKREHPLVKSQWNFQNENLSALVDFVWVACSTQNRPRGLSCARMSDWLSPSQTPPAGIRRKEGSKANHGAVTGEGPLGPSLLIPVFKPPSILSQPRTLHPLPCRSSTHPLHMFPWPRKISVWSWRWSQTARLPFLAPSLWQVVQSLCTSSSSSNRRKKKKKKGRWQ